ncbi:hypothetical protein H1P_4860002 [Hyella patelloides LEGE 07179]|uniref:Uncharacterized protein n=1 Tax=Hyella patelloides LEGE 07179 TaxID=945734 RepID=A0A563VZ56_9CYAN|nr:hypothetical protein H1P_4860002 [Hyella patelloides LEGE 07179]
MFTYNSLPIKVTSECNYRVFFLVRWRSESLTGAIKLDLSIELTSGVYTKKTDDYKVTFSVIAC